MKPIRPWLDYKKFIESLDIKVINLELSYTECLLLLTNSSKSIKTTITMNSYFNDNPKISTVEINHGLDLIYAIYIPYLVKTFEVIADNKSFKSDYPQDENGYINFETPIPIYRFEDHAITIKYSVDSVDEVMNAVIPKIKLIYVLLNTDDRNVLMRSNFHYTFKIADAK